MNWKMNHNIPGIDKVVPQGLMWDTILAVGAILTRTLIFVAKSFRILSF